MGVTRGTSTFPNGNGKISGDGKTSVVEEGAIEDEAAEGLVISTRATSINLQWLRWSSQRYR